MDLRDTRFQLRSSNQRPTASSRRSASRAHHGDCRACLPCNLSSHDARQWQSNAHQSLHLTNSVSLPLLATSHDGTRMKNNCWIMTLTRAETPWKHRQSCSVQDARHHSQPTKQLSKESRTLTFRALERNHSASCVCFVVAMYQLSCVQSFVFNVNVSLLITPNSWLNPLTKSKHVRFLRKIDSSKIFKRNCPTRVRRSQKTLSWISKISNRQQQRASIEHQQNSVRLRDTRHIHVHIHTHTDKQTLIHTDKQADRQRRTDRQPARRTPAFTHIGNNR